MMESSVSIIRCDLQIDSEWGQGVIDNVRDQVNERAKKATGQVSPDAVYSLKNRRTRMSMSS